MRATNDRRNLVYPFYVIPHDAERGSLTMPLPAPDLDDRTFQDIVDEAKRLIPRYCPEWTNHNVSDPGVALIELFAWMSEMVLFRVNQVPDRLYVHFLNMVGIEPFPPSVARTDLTFWLSRRPRRSRSWCPPSTEVMTHGERHRAAEARGLQHGRRPRHRPAGAGRPPWSVGCRRRSRSSTSGRTSGSTPHGARCFPSDDDHAG